VESTKPFIRKNNSKIGVKQEQAASTDPRLKVNLLTLFLSRLWHPPLPLNQILDWTAPHRRKKTNSGHPQNSGHSLQNRGHPPYSLPMHPRQRHTGSPVKAILDLWVSTICHCFVLVISWGPSSVGVQSFCVGVKEVYGAAKKSPRNSAWVNQQKFIDKCEYCEIYKISELAVF